ncbi:hypothetical protein JCM3770_001511 [Rhodotorula araucariae]
MAAPPSPAPPSLAPPADDQPEGQPASSSPAPVSAPAATSNGLAGPPPGAGTAPSRATAPSLPQQQQPQQHVDQHAQGDPTRKSKPPSRFAFASTATSGQPGASGDDSGLLPKPVRRLNPDNRPGPPSSLTPAQPAPPATSIGTAASSSSSHQTAALPQQQQQQAGAVFPALHLTPLNGTFVPKQISLDPPGVRVKIGRQTNAKTIPNGTNGYFDSKVLSRAHAEVWSEEGRVFIKDVKSSNGTFINGERLSPESSESDVFELHTDDIVEFGIDILTDDTKTIVHHKVAAKVHLVLNAEDAIASSREINNWYRSAGEQNMGRAQRAPRAPAVQSGLSFEHVLSRLQGELQKSRDTGVNLGDVNSTLNVVHDTLGGGAPPALPPQHAGPRVGSAFPPRADVHAQSIAALQQQLSETQQSLQGHVGKIRDLEGLLAEHDALKREVGSLRAQMDEARESMSAMIRDREYEAEERHRARARRTNGRESPLAALLDQDDDDDDLAAAEADDDDDDDDAASVASVETVSPANLARGGVNGLRAKQAHTDEPPEADEDEPTLAPAPAPTAAAAVDVDTTDAPPSSTAAAAAAADVARERLLQEQNAKLVARLEALSAELDESMSLGAALRTQHAAASETIRALEARVASLEAAVDRRVAEAEGRAEQRWDVWRKRFEQTWADEQKSWAGERDQLRELVREWEEHRRLEAERAAAHAHSGSGSGDDDDGDDGPASSSGSDRGADVSPDAAPRKKRSARRRKRSSLTPVPPAAGSSSSSSSSHAGVGGLRAESASSSSPLARASRLAHALAPAGELASDSDSTIGDAVGRARSGSSPGAGGGIARDAHSEEGLSHPKPLSVSLGAAVVVLAVAVGYGAAMKLKE